MREMGKVRFVMLNASKITQFPRVGGESGKIARAASRVIPPRARSFVLSFRPFAASLPSFSTGLSCGRPRPPTPRSFARARARVCSCLVHFSGFRSLAEISSTVTFYGVLNTEKRKV